MLSIILYGSVIFDDLAPGYGDLDFLAVVDDDLSEEDFESLIGMRKPLRSETSGIYDHMLEGAFLPRKMLSPDIKGRALWWGTTREVPWHSNQLGWLVLHVIRERGKVIYGMDLKQEIPTASSQFLLEDIANFCRSVPAIPNGDIHDIDWLLTSARLLLFLKEHRLSSKSEAADWGVSNAQGVWKAQLWKAKHLRLNPQLLDSAEWRNWLASLGPFINEAREELEAGLLKLDKPG
ncbi:DUF4111 domain-containing protein [candidate division WOR-3 bacterium]|nr:DUF4111 domain-containing protein [candidate division WOR-3 bacterium]